MADATAVLALTFLAASFFKRAFNNYIRNSSADLHVDFRQYSFVRYLVASIIYIAGFACAIHLIPGLRNLSLSIFADSGMLVAMIGFASQMSIANIVSGLFITIFKPFRVGDRIKLTSKGLGGVVEDITLRIPLLKPVRISA